MSEAAKSSGTLDVVVVSPARPIFEGTARSVVVPTWNRIGGDRRGIYGRRSGPADDRLAVGEIGILPGHAPIVAAIGSGIMRIGLEGGSTARFAVRGGFLKVGEGRVTVLVDHAVAEADVNAAEAQKELDQTRAELRSPDSDQEFAELLDRRAWSESQLKLVTTPGARSH